MNIQRRHRINTSAGELARKAIAPRALADGMALKESRHSFVGARLHQLDNAVANTHNVDCSGRVPQVLQIAATPFSYPI